MPRIRSSLPLLAAVAGLVAAGPVPVASALQPAGTVEADYGATADHASEPASAEIKRSLPNGRTDVIKAMGNTKWDTSELK